MLRIIIQWCQAPPSSKATAWDTVAQKSPRRNTGKIFSTSREATCWEENNMAAWWGQQPDCCSSTAHFGGAPTTEPSRQSRPRAKGAPGTVHADTGARASVPEWVLREAPRSGVKGCRAPRPERGGGRCSRAALRPRLEGNDGEAGEAGGSPAAVHRRAGRPSKPPSAQR